MHSGTALLHGIIQLICGLAKRLTKRGSNPVPKDEDPESYREVYEWVVNAHKEGALINHLIEGFLHFRAVDVRLTAATGYAWQWNKTVSQEEARRRVLVKENGNRNLMEVVVEEYGKYARPEKEVSIPEVIAKVSVDGGFKELARTYTYDQKYVVYGAPLDINKNIEIKVTVDPQGIPSDEVVGWIRTSGGEIIPLKFKGEENNHYAFGADLPRISLDDFEAEAVVTAGLWEQVQKFIVSAKISPRDREEIREESHEKFMIDTPQGSRRVELHSEAALTMKVKVPFAKEHLMDRVSLGIYTTTRSAYPKDWRFLSHDEYCVTDFYWKNGYLGWTISYTPSLSGKLTFALFDKLEDTMAPPAAISWANKEGDDIEVKNIVPTFSHVKGGAPGQSNFANPPSSSPISLPLRVPLANHRELVNRYGAGDIGKIALIKSDAGNWEYTVKWTAQGIDESLFTELINAIKGYLAQAPPQGLQKLDITLTLDPQKLDVQNTVYALTIDIPVAVLNIHPWLIETAKDSSLEPLLTDILRLAFKSLETNFYQLAVSDSYVYYAPRRNELIQLLKVIDEQGLVLDEEYLTVLRQLNALQWTDLDSYLFSQGTHQRLFEKLGAHIVKAGDKTIGTYFAVWAPYAQEVCLLGDFNGWRYTADYMYRIEYNGIWVMFVPKIGDGSLYKFAVKGGDESIRHKSDPFALLNQFPTYEQQNATASIVWDAAYRWNDEGWMKARAAKQAIDAPISVLQIHLGSWMRGENNRWLTYRELAPKLVDYIDAAKQDGMAYTHVQFNPVTEHFLYSSMGYLVSCYYAPTSRHGQPQDYMYLIDYLHQHDIGVFDDKVYAHFPKDEAGLYMFDGTHQFTYDEAFEREHPRWGTNTFNYARGEVRSFLVSNSIFWLEKYHIDGSRMDAVASMLYWVFDRSDDEKRRILEKYWTEHNDEAARFIQYYNYVVHKEFFGTLTIAENSSQWPGVTRRVDWDGLGFDRQWAMGFMHDVLEYLKLDPIYRKYHQDKLTFYWSYALSEKYMIAFSHDEVIQLKRSLKEKMPGDEWQKLANLRLLFGMLFFMPGNKLAFMGGELGVFKEWNPDESLDWWLLEYPLHKRAQNLVRVLNRLYRNEPAFHQLDFDPRGFHWIDCSDRENSIISFIRRGHNPEDDIVVIFNFTPVPRHNYRVGLPHAGYWQEIFNSDATCYGGSNVGNYGGGHAPKNPRANQKELNQIKPPPLGFVVFKRSSSAVEDVTDSRNIIKGLIKLDELVEKKHREIPENEKIYMRIFGPSLSFKTDLAMFIQRYGIGGIDTKNIVWVETDELHKKHYFYPYIDEEKVKRIVPREIAQLSVGKRLVILEGIYSALFHPSGEWYFYKDNAPSMDIEVAVECSRHIRQARAIRRDGSTVRLDTGDEHLADWMTAIDGRDVRINTDLAEEIEALERLVYESKPLLKYKERLVPLLEHFIEFAKEQKEYFEKQSKKGFSAGSPLAFKHEQQITLIKFKHHIKIQKTANASSSLNREYLSQLPREHISGKIFLVRVDYNDQHWDPSTGELVDARRFRASLPTIIFIVKNGGWVILATHQGRPQGRVVDDLRLNRARLTISVLLGEPVRLLEGKEDNDGRFRLITDEVKNRVKAM